MPGILMTRVLNRRYQLLSRIGAGGFATVYKAEDSGLDNRTVAIKKIDLQGLPAQEVYAASLAFQREMRFL